MKMQTALEQFLGNLNILDTLWIDTFGYAHGSLLPDDFIIF